ncbi:MAG: hypothetical protein ACOY4I_06735 [Bacillota bacterium]
MYEKRCFRCGGFSYSASTYGGWTCPYCGQDLSQAPAKPAGKGQSLTDRIEVPDMASGPSDNNVIIFPKNKKNPGL